MIKTLTTVNVIYYRLDYPSLIQEFIWQTEDVVPQYPRVHKFLNYWQKNIDAIIKEIMVSSDHKHKHKILHIDAIFRQ